MLSYKLIQPDEISTSIWSGGTTTQLAIYPENESYADRNFLWRLSSATVDEEESCFTALADYHRFILMQKGSVSLTHNGGSAILLPPWKVHEFDGGDETLSVGRATDFNLMLRKGCAEGLVKVLVLEGQEKVLLPEQFHPYQFLALYCSEGNLKLFVEEEEALLEAGGLFLGEKDRKAAASQNSRDLHLAISNPCPDVIHVIVCGIRTHE